ncbi:MAG TPA: hypothetical protein VJP45_03395 [Candidatus Limnocylindria bacterium]|nr:hypothetical protein [Candidatus Limnocylindria bacterium]
MDDAAVERTLAACEQGLTAGGTPDLRALGFWRAVAAVKRRRDLVDRYARRIGAIDRETFLRRVRFAVPIGVGVIVLDIGLFGGLALLAAAPALDHPWRELLVLAALGALAVTTHGLAHLAVGTFAGIDFTHWFFDARKMLPPGFKVDYASYLRASPRARAWMHASGAIVTKLVPFLVLIYALAIDTDMWAVLVILASAIVAIVVDALFSVRVSDWKKFRREMRFAR